MTPAKNVGALWEIQLTKIKYTATRKPQILGNIKISESTYYGTKYVKQVC